MSNQPARAMPALREAAPLPLLEVSFPAAADRLKLVRPCVHAAALMSGFTELTARDIVLAVDEACQNIIVHGYGVRLPASPGLPATRSDITVCIFRLRDGIRITLADRATPVDPAAIQPRDLAQLRPGGLGVHFIRQTMDQVDHLPGPGGTGNTLELIKYHRPSQ